MSDNPKTYMERIWDWWRNSEVILWSQLQVLLGIVWGVVSTTDLSPLINNPKVFTGWMIANGVITQWLRQRGTVNVNGHLVSKDDLDPGDPQGR